MQATERQPARLLAPLIGRRVLTARARGCDRGHPEGRCGPQTEYCEGFALFDGERHAIDSIRLGAFVAFDQLDDFDDSYGC